MLNAMAHIGIYLDRLNSTGGNLSIQCNDSISSWTFFLTISPQRTGGTTVMARDYMVDRDYHVLRKGSRDPTLLCHVLFRTYDQR